MVLFTFLAKYRLKSEKKKSFIEAVDYFEV